MADRAALTVNKIVRAGLEYALVEGKADGHSFPNNGATFLAVNNASLAEITVTIVTPGTMDGLAIADRTVKVGASKTLFIGPFATTVYNQTNGQVYVDLSAAADVTIGAFRM